jgi:hypothetical protein
VIVFTCHMCRVESINGKSPGKACLKPDPIPQCYEASRAAGGSLLRGSNGIVDPSVRRPSGTCVTCFRPASVFRPRHGKHFGTQSRRGRRSLRFRKPRRKPGRNGAEASRAFVHHRALSLGRTLVVGSDPTRRFSLQGREQVQPCDVGHYPEPLRAPKDEAIATELESVREILAPALSTIREVIADQASLEWFELRLLRLRTEDRISIATRRALRYRSESAC